MIEFKCQHCGKGLHLSDSYAGRDGWCRVCKRMVIVPGGGAVLRVEDLPPEEGYERLQRLLQYAATKADKYKVHLAREAKEKEHAAQTEGARQQAELALAERELALERMRDEHVSLASTLREREARLAVLESAARSIEGPSPEVESEMALLRADLAAEREARQALSTAMEARGAVLQGLEEEVAALQVVVADAHGREEVAAADRVNIRALEGAVATLKTQLAQAESERDRLAEILEEGSAGERDSTLLLMQKDRELAALNVALAEMRAQQEEASRSTRDQIASLESQVLLFNEIKERMTGFQERIKELEQERLDASLALDGAQQAEVLHQKKIGVLEVSLKQALAEQSERAIQAEHFQRELAVRDEQVRKLAEELQALTEGRGTAVLEAEKSTRTARSAENRAKRLTVELGDMQGARDQLAAENDVLKRSAAELEARVTSLHGSLEAARADAAEKAAYEPAAAALQAELSTALLALERAEENGAAEKASLHHTVAELQAENLNLTELIQRETERTAAVEAQLALIPPAEAEAARETELASRLERIAALEAELKARDETVARQQAEAEEGARALGASQERIAALEAALAASEERFDNGDDGRDDDGGDEDVGFILLSPERAGTSGGTVLESNTIDERQRQLEKKQMMDVLSDFLNK